MDFKKALDDIDTSERGHIERTKELVLEKTKLAMQKAADDTYKILLSEIDRKAQSGECKFNGERKVIEGTLKLEAPYEPYEVFLTKKNGEEIFEYNEAYVSPMGRVKITIKEGAELFFDSPELFTDFIEENEFDPLEFTHLFNFKLIKWSFWIENPTFQIFKPCKVYTKPSFTKHGGFYFSTLSSLCEANGIKISPIITYKNGRSKRQTVPERETLFYKSMFPSKADRVLEKEQYYSDTDKGISGSITLLIKYYAMR